MSITSHLNDSLEKIVADWNTLIKESAQEHGISEVDMDKIINYRTFPKSTDMGEEELITMSKEGFTLPDSLNGIPVKTSPIRERR